MGIESTAFTAQNHPDGFLGAYGVLVAALTDQRIINIGQGNHLGPDGDLIPRKTVRITAAIPALVMVQGNIIGIVVRRKMPHLGNARQQFGTLYGVRFDDFKFFRRQAPFLM